MSIETAVFAVQRGDQQFSCKGIDLLEKLTDGDILLVNRGGVDYHFVLEEQGVFSLIKHVNFEFNVAGAIVITQNAEAKGGNTPYKLVTEYDVTLGTEIYSYTLEDRAPVAASVLHGDPYISFGDVSVAYSSIPQDIWALSVERGEYIEQFNSSASKNNRYGLKKSIFQDKEILINVYNKYGAMGLGGKNTQQIIYFGLDETYDTGVLTHDKYVHLHSSQYKEAACAGFISDRDGNYYSSWYRDGLFQHKEVPEDTLGYPDFLSKSIVTTQKHNGADYNVGYSYYKGLAYHKKTNSILWSTDDKIYQYSIDTDSTVLLSSKPLETDNNRSVALSFTSEYVIRTVIDPDGTIKSNECGKLGSADEFEKDPHDPWCAIYINDPDNKYLFKILPNETIKMLDYNYQGDPFSGSAPWEELRPEPMPPGELAGVAAIILEPFNLMWYQDNQLKNWGIIPDRTQAATVRQTITDANGDSVSSSRTKAPL